MNICLIHQQVYTHFCVYCGIPGYALPALYYGQQPLHTTWHGNSSIPAHCSKCGSSVTEPQTVSISKVAKKYGF